MFQSLRLIVVVVAIALPGIAQTLEHIPDSDPTQGTCNAIPLGSTFGAGYSYMGRIPASALSASLANGDLIVADAALAPCDSGVWTGTSVLMGFGHLPPVLPSPFLFPDQFNIGSFSDFTVIWDTSIHGPYSWTATANTWSPLNLTSSGVTPFAWNGVDDIGFYMTYSQGTINTSTGWTGTVHRTNTEPFRYYASGFLAPSSTASGAAGMKMQLIMAQGSSSTPFIMAVGPSGNGSVVMSVIGIPAATTFGWTFASASPQVPTGTGPDFGILADQLTLDIYGAFFPYPAVGHPFHWTWPVSGAYPAVSLPVPGSVAASLSGMNWDWVSLAFNANGLIAPSNVVNYTW